MRSPALLLLLLPALAAAAAPAAARTIARQTPELAFRYAWPALPPGLKRLEARLAGEAASARRQAQSRATKTWAEERANYDSDEHPPRHGYEKHWRIRAATPRLLALEGDIQFYTGGAHEAIDYDALLWDRRRDSPLPLDGLFTVPRRALAAMEKAYCAELKAEQRERRGNGFREEEFRCPPIRTVPVVLTGKGGRITGFEALLQPYLAGSFAEGPYEVEVRFAPSVLRLVKPEFRVEFGR